MTTPVETVNKFFARGDLNDTESVIKSKVIELDKTLAESAKELEELTKQTNEKQAAVMALNQQMQALLGLVVDLQTQKESATPVLVPAEVVAGA